MGRSSVIVALVPLLSGCVVTTSRGALLRTTPRPDRCHHDSLRGTLDEEGDALRLTVTGQLVCERVEVAEYETERVSSPSKVVSIGAGVLAGAAVAVPAVLLLSWLLEPHATAPNGNSASTGNALAMLALIPAAAAGGGVWAGVNAMKSREPGPVERVERVAGVEPRGPSTPSGTLVAENTSRSWRVENGTAVLPVAELRDVRLGRLLLDGQLVELQGASARRAESLDACRRALTGWTPAEPCAQALRRAEAAKRCDEFWTSARELEARVVECRAAEQSPAVSQ